jgi:iron complex outermembrane receptor protein
MKLLQCFMRSDAGLGQRICVLSASGILAASTGIMMAQAAPGLQGSVLDAKGGLIAKASISAKNDQTGKVFNGTADDSGHFSLAGVPAGAYTVTVTAPGFSVAVQRAIVAADGTGLVSVTLAVNSATDSIEVEANAVGSVAAALAPMDALLAKPARAPRSRSRTSTTSNRRSRTTANSSRWRLPPSP